MTSVGVGVSWSKVHCLLWCVHEIFKVSLSAISSPGPAVRREFQYIVHTEQRCVLEETVTSPCTVQGLVYVAYDIIAYKTNPCVYRLWHHGAQDKPLSSQTVTPLSTRQVLAYIAYDILVYRTSPCVHGCYITLRSTRTCVHRLWRYCVQDKSLCTQPMTSLCTGKVPVYTPYDITMYKTSPICRAWTSVHRLWHHCVITPW